MLRDFYCVGYTIPRVLIYTYIYTYIYTCSYVQYRMMYLWTF